MLKHLIILLLISGLYSDVIIYEPSPFVTVVKRNVKFIGIFTDGVKYKVNSSDYEFIECNLIVEILDDNENPIEFNCKPEQKTTKIDSSKIKKTYNHIYNLINKNNINATKNQKIDQSIKVVNNPTNQTSNKMTTEYNLLELFGGINPCENEIINLIDDMGINGVSDREFEYYKIQSKKCYEYRKYILGSQNNNIKVDPISKEALFLVGRKDPGIAQIFNFIIPSSGHAYIGKWGQGLPFLFLSYCGTLISQSQVQTGSIIMLGAAIWSIFDGNKVAKEHNNELYKSIYGIDMPEDLMHKNQRVNSLRKLTPSGREGT